ncbi:MAG: ribosome silencing factor [Clostridiales bacterium]|jgi:ribosome-associated protein|nr:ribosome silencing factor [Clostridiales bacterium]
MNPEELRDAVCRLLDEKKAADITVLDVGGLTVLADYFIVAGGTSATNVKALAGYVEEKLSGAGVEPLRKEGLRDARWVVYDYGSVIVHILLDDMRLVYCLEQLWNNGKNLKKYGGDGADNNGETVNKTANETTDKTARKAAGKSGETSVETANRKAVESMESGG